MQKACQVVRSVNWITFSQMKAKFQGKRGRNFHIRGHAIHTRESKSSGIGLITVLTAILTSRQTVKNL